jgi:O-antigen/teichoic acid export membrane protein
MNGMLTKVLPQRVARLGHSELGQQLARGVFWSFAGVAVSRGLALLGSILTARWLGQEGYGEYGLLQSTVMAFQVVAGFGLGLTATRHVAETRVVNPLRAGRIIAFSSVVAFGTGLLAAACLFLAAPWLAEHSLAAPWIVDNLRACAPLVLLSAVLGAQTGSLAGFEAFRVIALVNAAAGVVGLPLLLLGAWQGGVTGAIWGTAAGLALNVLFQHLALRREAARADVPLGWSGWRREYPVFMSFSLPTVLSSLLVAPIAWLCNAMLVNQPDGYVEMGLFNAANQWRALILFLPGVICTPLLPLLTSLRAAADLAKYRRVLLAGILATLATALACAAPVILLGQSIMRTYGPGFEQGSNVLSLLVLATVLNAVLNVIAQTIASDGRMWWGFVLNSMWAVALMGSFCFLRDRGAAGLALANLLAYSLHLVTVSIYAWTVTLTQPAPRGVS